VAAAATVAIAAVPAAASAAPARFRLAGSSPRAARTTASNGAVAGGTQINFSVALTLPDANGAAALAHAVSTAGSAQYHQFLTPAQWEQRFSPSEQAVDDVSSFLTSSGISVTGVQADRMAVYASGTAAQIERAFATSLSTHDVLGQSLRVADSDLSVPASLAGEIAGVAGVSQTLAASDATVDAPPSKHVQTPGSSIAPPAVLQVATPCAGYFGQIFDTTLPNYGSPYPPNPAWAVCGYTPGQFRSVYNLNGPADGTGATVAVVDAYASPTLYDDAAQFAATYDPANPLRKHQFSEDVAHPYEDASLCDASGWYEEQTLDVESVHSTAPGANIVYVGGRSCNDTDLAAALAQVVDHHLADVATNSYGDPGGDLAAPAADQAAFNDVLLMAAGTGVSVLFSSGDSGDEYVNYGQSIPDFPAVSPLATAVGGTTTEIGADGSLTGETGWSTARSFLCNAAYEAAGRCTAAQLGSWLPIGLSLGGGSGGGTSYTYLQPPYQAGVVPSSMSEANAGVLGTSQPMRVEPDIAAEGDPATGTLVGETLTFPSGVRFGTFRIGGTSVASPMTAGIVARAVGMAGHPLGFLNPALYSMYGASGAFNDVLASPNTDMSRADFANSFDSSLGFFYSTRIVDYEGAEKFCDPTTNVCTTQNVSIAPAAGYDNMTGLGSPGSSFVTQLAGH
jgi:subtilase family serine protease